MSLAFGGKMNDRQLALYKKEKRRENRSKAREALFISEYVFYKHFNVYQEAAEMYNELNQIYPQKPDLRRTEQFRTWTHVVTGQANARTDRKQAKRRPYVFPRHLNIPIAKYVDPNASFVVVTEHPESPQTEMTGHAESPEPESPQTEMTGHAESPESESPQTEMTGHAESPESESPQTEMTGHAESPESESHRVKNGKIMELKIPLMS